MVQNFIIVHLVIIEPSFAEVNVSQHCTKFCEIVVLFVFSAVDGSVFFFSRYGTKLYFSALGDH
jgi:hypothetical protein